MACRVTHSARKGFAGVSDDAIAHRVATGRLVRLRRGHFLLPSQPGDARGRLLGALLTAPVRTLFDPGTMLGAEAHVAAANEAFVRRLCTIEELRAARTRYAGRKGSRAFDRLLRTLDPEGREIRSPLEARLNSFLRARCFPPWESNVLLEVGGEMIRPDVLWRPQRVIVEADRRDPHLSPLTCDKDRRRDRRLSVEGWQPVRVTARDLGLGADELAADLHSLLRLS